MISFENENECYEVFKWCIGIISSYSFTIGNDKYQCLVPIWDFLNHSTTEYNIRLNHNASQGRLEMIAIKVIFITINFV